MKRILLALLLLIGFAAQASATVVYTTLVFVARDQTLAPQAVTSTESDWQVSANQTPGARCTVQFTCTQPWYFTSSPGNIATLYVAIPANTPYTITVSDGQQFGVATTSANGTLYMQVIGL